MQLPVDERPGGETAPPAPSPDWHALPVEQVFDRLTTGPQGLSGDAARDRLDRYGTNRLDDRRRIGWPRLMARQFQNVLILILVVAVAISLAIGERVDAAAIAAIILLNAALGFIQEWRAERALDALRRMLAPTSTVIRDGRRQEIDRGDLVPGDIVCLKRGDRTPADIRLIETVDLRADEAALTGEAAPVSKHPAPTSPQVHLAARTGMSWMGTDIVAGQGQGVVVATGMATEFGRIAALAQAAGDTGTPLQRKLDRLGRRLALFAIAVSVLVTAAGWLAGRPLDEMALTAISLAVAVVPEGLPAVVTIVLALGAAAMVRHNALVRRLQAIEALGAATVVCTDKTGTLTRGEMTVTDIWLPAGSVSVDGAGDRPHGHFHEDGHVIAADSRPDLMAALETGNVCNHASLAQEDGRWRVTGEPTEAALKVAAAKAGFSDGAPVRVCEFPFDSDRKRMSVIVDHESGQRLHMKGAPEVVLAFATHILDGATVRPIVDADRHVTLAAYHNMAARGLRTLAVARRDLPANAETPGPQTAETGLTLLGVFGISDPPRAEARHAVDTARSAGIGVIMITGDAAPTAAAIAGQLDLPTNLVLARSEFAELADAELAEKLKAGAVLARATPEDKMRVVRLLQARGEIVAMTGDGVNDAPALKQADIGVAMGVRGTDVAKNVADIVLLDDNFASIIAAIREGRRQFANIQKFVRYLLSSNIGEVLAVAVALIAGGPMILLPVQILWMNLVTDGLSALALGVEKGEPDLMEQPPRRPSEGVLDRPAMLLVSALGGYLALGALGLFAVYLATPDLAARAQTMAFTAMIVMEKFNVMNFRTMHEPATRIGLFSNRLLIGAVAATLGLQVLAVHAPILQPILHTVPLTLADWGVILAVSAPIFLIPESVKWLLWHRRRRHHIQVVQ
ncbi:cation-translocating P-type ATPase [Maricaulis virginensis]|uniref:ATPase n=1 Tax=Maricaulis virginensis TaxID=144022 RepID=A0A9W6INM2_9PROT|nr:cation-transporting P-type ATPase [Maricaulis virginensis]GLK52281.1 ATPase [Maricaulis virginensis]